MSTQWPQEAVESFLDGAGKTEDAQLVAALAQKPDAAFLGGALLRLSDRAREEPALLPCALPALVRLFGAQVVLGKAKSQLTAMEPGAAERYIPVVYALGHFRVIRREAYALADSRLAACAYGHLSRITDVNDRTWRDNRARAQAAGSLLDDLERIGYPPATSAQPLADERHMSLLLREHFDSEVRAVIARYAGSLWRGLSYELSEVAERRKEDALGEEAERALRRIELHAALTGPVEESLSLLRPDAPLAVQCAILGRLRGAMRPSYLPDVEPFLQHAQPIVAASALCLMSEVSGAHRVCIALVEMLRKPPELLTTVFALRMLYDIRDVWLSSSVPSTIRTLIERHGLHTCARWTRRACAARLMGMCGMREELLSLLEGDPVFSVRRAAFVGLGGVEAEGVRRPLPREGDVQEREEYRLLERVEGLW